MLVIYKLEPHPHINTVLFQYPLNSAGRRQLNGELVLKIEFSNGEAPAGFSPADLELFEQEDGQMSVRLRKLFNVSLPQQHQIGEPFVLEGLPEGAEFIVDGEVVAVIGDDGELDIDFDVPGRWFLQLRKAGYREVGGVIEVVA